MEEVRRIVARKVVYRKIFGRDGIGKPFSFFDADDGSDVQCVRHDAFEHIERKPLHIALERSQIQLHGDVQVGVACFRVDFRKGNLQNAYGDFFVRYRQFSARLLIENDFGKRARLLFGQNNGFCRRARNSKRRKINGISLIALAFFIKHDVAQPTFRLRFQIGKVFAFICRR